MRDKKTIIYLLIISMFLLSMMALLASAEMPGNVSAKSWALYNPDTKSFLGGKNLNMQLPMASTTKIITGLIAIENLNMQEVITVPREAVGVEGSSLYLSEGDRITVQDLVYSLLLQSANDAAEVLALRISGSIDEFAELMNSRAAEIGATDTHFENPHGLDDDDHYTTAHDLALITATALENDIFAKICSTYKYTFSIGEKSRTVVNHNKLLKKYNGCNGVKTGFTKKCGRCLVSSAKRDGITLVAVTLSAPNDWNDHTKILDNGFDRLEAIEISELAEIPSELSVILGNKERIKIGVSEEDRYFVKYKENSVLSTDVKLLPYLTKSTKSGDAVGKISITTETSVKEIDIIALEDVKVQKHAKSFWQK